MILTTVETARRTCNIVAVLSSLFIELLGCKRKNAFFVPCIIGFSWKQWLRRRRMLDLSWTVFRVECFPEVLFWVAQAFSSQLPSQLKVRDWYNWTFCCFVATESVIGLSRETFKKCSLSTRFCSWSKLLQHSFCSLWRMRLIVER